ncbi:unnamed protein product, partial [Ixodes pacificus]
QGSSISDIFGPGEPLYLTPLIEKDQLDKARTLSRVGTLGLVWDVPSYSGFLTVNPSLGSNIFFWFFPAMENPRTAPVLLWLQGGPGSSSMFGLFVEHGPYSVDKGGIPQLRQVTWARRYSMLYVDNPVGTGFSFTQQDQGYTRNETDVGRDLFEALQQFFTIYPEYVGNAFYATGESYAGKYVPAIGHAIDTAVQPRVKINLKGIAIGNADIDPLTMMDYADYLYEIGLVDRNQAAVLRGKTDAAINLIKQGRYLEANDVVAPIFDGSPSIYNNLTGFTNYFNYLLTKEPVDQLYYISFIQTTRVRKAIHVGSLPFYDFNPMVYDNFNGDKMVSAKPWFTSLLEKYKVLLYSGQLDIVVAYPYTESFLASLNWTGAGALAAVSRQIWRTPGGKDIYGYVRQVANFTEVLVRNGGHILPYDQPEAAYDMITRFIDGKPFV